MSLENWVKNSWLERLASDSAEIARLLGIADSRLEDYQKAVAGKLSPDVQLNLAYDAIRASAPSGGSHDRWWRQGARRSRTSR